MTHWPSRRFTELAGIAHPIVQAPMKGASTPELAAAVSEAGGLGSLGCAGMEPDALRELMETMRRRTNRPFNLNFFAHGPVAADDAALARTRGAIAPAFEAAGLDAPPEEVPLEAPAAFSEAVLEVLLAAPPPVVSFHFGLPAGDAVRSLRSAGAKVLCTATSVDEANALADAGVDAIIAQGWEAGGHRGAFSIEPGDAGTGLMALVPQIADAVEVPVIAAGGIADGRGIAAALLLGADGVQIGTAFLACPESAASAVHRQVMASASDTATRLTRAHSGRPARAHRTRYIDGVADREADMLPYPLMYPLIDPLTDANKDPDDPEGRFLLYGQAAGLARAEPASELVARLVSETGKRLGAGAMQG